MVLRISILTVSILCIVFTLGCGQSVDTPKRIGIILYGGSRAPQADGLVDGLSELGYRKDQNIHYTILNANNDKAKLDTYAMQLIEAKVDVLVAGGGLEADAIKKIASPSAPPTVVLYVNSIVERKLVDTRANPGWNVTGIDNLNAELSEKRVELIRDLLPQSRRILILYYPSIDPSRIGVDYARKAAQKFQIEIVAKPVQTVDDIRTAMNAIKENEYDAMLTVPTAPIDNALRDVILPRVKQLRLPLFTHSRSLVEAGALASYGAPFYDLGKQGARLADKVLRGVSASRIPFETPKTFIYSISRNQLDFLGLTLTELTKSQINEYL